MRIISNVTHADLDQFLWDQGEDPVYCVFLHEGGMALIHNGELPEQETQS